jgi:hypothetical protein
MNKDLEIENINKEIAGLDSQIRVLEAKKLKLEKCLMASATSVEERFRLWFDSSNKEHSEWLIDRGTKLRDWYDKHRDLQRYREYDVCEDIDYSMGFILDPEGYEEDGDKMNEDDKTFLLELAKELIESNIGSFTCDW